MDLSFYIFLALAFLLAVVVILIFMLSRQAEPGRSFPSRRRQYITAEFSEQMELDLRLPYRRFKRLYPDTRLTYTEYKNMQMTTAFKRSMSSQENKRMVR